MRLKTTLRVVSSAAALLALSVPFLLPAPALAADDIVCRANYDFCVEVDGKYPQDARFFASDTKGKFLVDIPANGGGMLIDLPARRAIAVPRNLITVDGPDGVVRVKDAIPVSAAAYALSLEGPVLRFQTDKAHVRVLKVLDRPPVVGEIALDALIADRMEYREGMKAYTPDKTAIDALKATKKSVELEAYFATWCSHCRVYMPKFLRVIKDAANPNIKLTLVGVPRGFGNEQGPWAGKSIQSIPAIIVKYEGKELTRLASHEGAVPEAELAGIIAALK